MNPILEARESRAKHIDDLMINYPNKTIVILKMNVVGENKNPLYLKFMYAYYNDIIIELFNDKVILNGHQLSDDGNYSFYVIDEIGTLVKVRTMEIEEAIPLGRLLDIDVFNHKVISRHNLSCEMRKCLMCNNDAHVCVRNKTHLEKDINDKMGEIVYNFLLEHLTNITSKAIYSELELYPSFGLVSHKDSGCHNDMEYETFIKSATAIKKYITSYIKEGFRKEIQPLNLKMLGLKAEKRMFRVTGGINTHKGLIFLLGVFLPSVVKTILLNESKAYLQELIKDISLELCGGYYDHIDSKIELSHSDKIFQKYNIKGIRQEAINGLKLVFDIPKYKEDDLDIAHHNYLIYLMSELNDTTIIHKTSLETLEQVKNDMKEIIHSGGYEQNKDLVQKLSDDYKQQSISPGGSADMLVIKIIYEDIKNLIRH